MYMQHLNFLTQIHLNRSESSFPGHGLPSTQLHLYIRIDFGYNFERLNFRACMYISKHAYDH